MPDQEMAWDGFTVPTRYWHALDDGRIQCDGCLRAVDIDRRSAA
jgi:hypothetical protein